MSRFSTTHGPAMSTSGDPPPTRRAPIFILFEEKFTRRLEEKNFYQHTKKWNNIQKA